MLLPKNSQRDTIKGKHKLLFKSVVKTWWKRPLKAIYGVIINGKEPYGSDTNEVDIHMVLHQTKFGFESYHAI